MESIDIKDIWIKPWEDEDLFREIRKIISEKTNNYTITEKLDKLIKNIPSIIASFHDCTTEEEYRMLAKKNDGTLASIQVKDVNTGFQVYAPIELNAYDYKKFYFETLAYCIITYVMFFKDIEFQIISNNITQSGILSITDQSLPHLLGLESKFVSSKDSVLMERIIPGYNSLNVLDKIMCIIKHNEEIIQYEIDNDVDIFNYYKNMQKNKEFLMLGRFFNQNEKNTEDKNNISLISNSGNQLCLYKISNMNETMNRNICKMIIQQLSDGKYFPRSLQAVSGEMIESFDIFGLLKQGTHNITLDGQAFEMNCEGDARNGFMLNVVNEDEMRGYMYSNLFYAGLNDDETINLIRTLIRDMKGDESIIDIYLNKQNVINLKEQFLHMYVKEATAEQIQHINMLLKQGNYKQVNAIIEEYTHNIINNKDLKNFGSGNPPGGGNQARIEFKEDFSTEDMDPQTFELYCILLLIDEYEKEQDKVKKELLHNEIQMAISRYRSPEEVKTQKSR